MKLLSVICLIALLSVVTGAEAVDLRSWDQKINDPNKRFQVLTQFSSEAVLDKETQLVWEQSPGDTNGDGGVDFNDLQTWHGAQFHCINKVVGGRLAWRLPTVQELASLVDPNNPNGDPDLPPGHPFNGVQPSSHWSASTQAADPTDAWNVSLVSGGVGGHR